MCIELRTLHEYFSRQIWCTVQGMMTPCIICRLCYLTTAISVRVKQSDGKPHVFRLKLEVLQKNAYSGLKRMSDLKRSQISDVKNVLFP